MFAYNFQVKEQPATSDIHTRTHKASMVASADSQHYEHDRSNIDEGVSQTHDAIAYSKINS
jgi:hypothetical protein